MGLGAPIPVLIILVQTPNAASRPKHLESLWTDPTFTDEEI